jgi:hypothetical protein
LSKCESDPDGAHHCQECQEQEFTIPAIKHNGYSKVILNTNLQRSAYLLVQLYGHIKPALSLALISRKAACNIKQEVEEGKVSDDA